MERQTIVQVEDRFSQVVERALHVNGTYTAVNRRTIDNETDIEKFASQNGRAKHRHPDESERGVDVVRPHGQFQRRQAKLKKRKQRF